MFECLMRDRDRDRDYIDTYIEVPYDKVKESIKVQEISRKEYNIKRIEREIKSIQEDLNTYNKYNLVNKELEYELEMKYKKLSKLNHN